MDKKHSQNTERLQQLIREYYAKRRPFRVYHGSTNSTRVMTFKRSEMVDISKLDRVLSVDTDKRVVIAEPNVPMDKLLRETLKYGMMPPVVMELPGITVGGAIQGSAIESGSFRWGCFAQTVEWMEMIDGSGEQIEVSPSQHTDLYYGAAGSCGSLGLVTAAAIKLIPAKKYVTITHHPVTSFQEAVDTVEKHTKTSCDFIECGMYSNSEGVVIVGNLSDSIIGKLRRLSRPFDPWYYLYVQGISSRKQIVTETLPLKDYIFRYNRGAFWAGRLAFEYIGTPFNAFTRFLLDPLMRTRKLYQALQDSAAGQQFICQDIVLPSTTVVSFMDYIDKTFNIYPTGFCPVKAEPRSPLQCNGLDNGMLYNVGVYGLRIEPYEEFIKVSRQIEAKTHELGGRKWFYAHSYYTDKEFWQIYDKKWYDKLRAKYHCSYLPNIYDKIRVKEKAQTINARTTTLKTIFGRAKLKIID